MVYRFKLVSDEVSNFSREIEVDSENTFLQLRNTILESVNYTKDELDSFFLCSDEWERQEEITLEDMGTTACDNDIWLMENTPIGELVEDEGQKLSFVFDYMTERSFFMELKEIIPNRSLVEPVCTIKRGKAPAQTVDMEEFDKKIDEKAKAAIEDFENEPFDENAFDDEDLSDGFDIMNIN